MVRRTVYQLVSETNVLLSRYSRYLADCFPEDHPHPWSSRRRRASDLGALQAKWMYSEHVRFDDIHVVQASGIQGGMAILRLLRRISFE